MPAPFGSFPFDASGVDNFAHPMYIQAFRDPTVQDNSYPIGTWWGNESTLPAVIFQYVGGSTGWSPGGNAEATTSSFGIVQLATLSELQNGNAPAGAYVPTSNDVATVIQGIVVGAVPPATETQAGIAEIATQIETDAGALDDKIVTPLKLKNFVASGGFPGVFTDLTATGAVSFTGATGGLTMTSSTASSLGVTGAGIDLTLSSAAGRVVVNGEEAAADAVRILSAAGGLDVDVALQMNLASSQNAADAIRIIASAGGIDVDAVGSAGEDINILNTGGSVYIGATESAADAVVVESTAGGIQILASGAAAGEDILLTATGSSIRLVSTENAADSIVLSSSNGGIQILAPAAAPAEDIVITATGSSVRITSTESATDSINIESTLGGINILASGASAGEDINLTATGSSINLSSTENAALAITLNTNGGTSETIRIRNQQGTNAASVDISSTAGGLTLTGGLGTADAINLVASTAGGGIDIDSSTGGFDVLTTGAISLDASLASNLTVTGAAVDLTLSSSGGSVVITGTEAAVDAIQLNATTALGGIDVNAGTGGMTIDSAGLLSLDAAGTTNLTTTGAFTMTVNSTLGQLALSSGLAAVNSVRINASDAAGGIDIDAGTAGITVDTTGLLSLDAAGNTNLTTTGAFTMLVSSTGGKLTLNSGEANADSVTVTSAGGMSMVATGAAAKDILITNTNGSMTLTAGENVTDAMNITASGAASRITLTAGTGSISLASGLVVKKKDLVFADSPYTVLGTDYFLSVDTAGGAITVTLPNAATLAGRTYVIRDTGGAAAASNITIATAGGNLVGGGASAATKTISAAYAGATVYSNGTTWNYCYVA